MKPRLEWIQGLRGLSAFIVIIHHLSAATGAYLGDTVMNLEWGWVGVDIFFVISGFIITYIHFPDVISRTGVRPFLRKRFVRIFPVYWVVLTVAFLIYLLLLNGRIANSGRVFSATEPSSWAFLAANYLLLPVPYYLVAVAWSLTYELFFYFIFAVGIRFGRMVLLLSGVLFMLLVIVRWVAGFTITGPARILFDPLLLEFAAGCLIGYMARYKKTFPGTAMLAGLLGLLFVAGCFYFGLYDHQFLRDEPTSFMIILAGSSLLVMLGVAADVHQSAGTPRFLVQFGNASYSAYIIHFLFVSVFCQVAASLLARTGYRVPAIWVFIVILLLVIAGSLIFYRLVEQPLLRVFRRRRTIPVEAAK